MQSPAYRIVMSVPIVERWVVILAVAVLSVSQARAQPRGNVSLSGPRHVFKGVTYENPRAWEEKQQADTRVLVAPNAHAGELLVVILSASSKVVNGPAADLEALARAAKLHVAKATHGPADSKLAGAFTIAGDWPADRVAELLPRAWLAARPAEQQPPHQATVVVT